MKLSVILPGIRPGNWLRLYESISESTKESFELVIISPYELPYNLRNKTNIKLIKDYGSPVRCQQIGLVNCEGDWIAWAADDGYFLPNALDIAFNNLNGKDEKTVIIGKYHEGNASPDMNTIKYYYIYTHDASRCKYLPTDCLMLMVGLVSKKELTDIGGFDCGFEVLPMAFNDVSIRLYNDKCKFIFQEEVMFKCGHFPGITGDHAPIHNAQIYYDLPKFKMIYSSEKSKERVNINFDNWKNSPERWLRRWGQK